MDLVSGAYMWLEDGYESEDDDENNEGGEGSSSEGSSAPSGEYDGAMAAMAAAAPPNKHAAAAPPGTEMIKTIAVDDVSRVGRLICLVFYGSLFAAAAAA